MPRVPEADLHPLAQVHHLAVLGGDHLLHGGLRVGHGVQGLHLGPAGTPTLLVLPLGVALLDEGGVPQHNGQQLSRQAGGVNFSPKPLLHQQGDAPRVVDVGVGDDDIVNVAGGKVQGVAVVLVPALLQSAVDEDLFAAHFQTVTAAGDRVGRAEECQLHMDALLNVVAGFLSTLYLIGGGNSRTICEFRRLSSHSRPKCSRARATPSSSTEGAA